MAETLGKVYVFNITGKAITAFAPNGLTAGPVADWSGKDSPAPYTPAQLVVAVVDPSAAPGNFMPGPNPTLFKTDTVFNCTIEVRLYDKGEDLVLYVSRTTWSLYGVKGDLRSQGDVASGPAFGQAL